MLGRLHLRIPSHQPDYPKSPSLPAVKVLIWLAVGVPMNATCSSFQLSLACTTHLTDRWQTKLGWKKEINEGLCMLSIHCSIPSILSPIPPPSRAQSFLGISYHHRQTTVKVTRFAVKWSVKLTGYTGYMRNTCHTDLFKKKINNLHTNLILDTAHLYHGSW